MKFGELSSLLYAVLILVLFLVADQWLGFNPQGNLLWACSMVMGVIALLYVWAQIDAVLEHRASSKAVARDYRFSMLPVMALFLGSVVKAILYYIYVPRPEVSFGLTGMGAWAGWLFGFWTAFDWSVIIYGAIAVTIDMTPFPAVMNEITETGRQMEKESKE